MKAEPIRVGDKFKAGDVTFEVIRVLPGGKLDLFDRARSRFTMRYHREVRTWERVS
jgi:hypothetical protein